MTVKVTVRQLQEQLPELLDRTVKEDARCVIQRNGKDYAVLVSARQWRRTIGRQLDTLGPEFRLSQKNQVRTEELLALRKQRRLTSAERRELNALLRESDNILLRRAEAMDRLS